MPLTMLVPQHYPYITISIIKSSLSSGQYHQEIAITIIIGIIIIIVSITRQKAGTTGWSLAGQTADGQMETIPTNRTDAKIEGCTNQNMQK